MLVAPIVLIVQTVEQETAADGIGAAMIVTMLLVAARVWILQRDAKKGASALTQSEERLRLAQEISDVGASGPGPGDRAPDGVRPTPHEDLRVG